MHTILILLTHSINCHLNKYLHHSVTNLLKCGFFEAEKGHNCNICPHNTKIVLNKYIIKRIESRRRLLLDIYV